MTTTTTSDPAVPMAYCKAGDHHAPLRTFPTTARRLSDGTPGRNLRECRRCRDTRYADLTSGVER